MTPISAPGAPDPPARNGYTLVELLVVLTIIGLVSAAVVTVLPSGKGAALAEAERFAARARHAQDKAILESRAVSVRIGAAGYGFDRRSGAEWVPIAAEPLVAAQWQAGVAPVLAGPEEVRLAFDPIGTSEPWRLVLRDSEDEAVVEFREDGRIHVSS